MNPEHVLTIKIYNNEDGTRQADVNIKGDAQELSQAVLGMMQSDQKFRMIIMEALLNAVCGNSAQVKEYSRGN